MSDEQQSLKDLKVDLSNLYREEIYTDLRVASLRRLVPVKVDGSVDDSRPTIYSGETQVMSSAGPLPIQCKIEADSLEDACAKFPEAINEAMERMVEEAREMQRREASRLVVPGGPIPPAPGQGGGLHIP